MAGLYIHIPYCTKACHYCDFHFSTNLGTRDDLIECLKREIRLKSDPDTKLKTIYFGGGTPSILTKSELNGILRQIYQSYDAGLSEEITIESNPEDLTLSKLGSYMSMGINRLSIGVQTFNDQKLKFLNRNHDSIRAKKAIRDAQQTGFENVSADLIFGIPGTGMKEWQTDLAQILEFNIPHISIYGLTIEERTAFGNWTRRGKIDPMQEDLQIAQFELAHEVLTENGYEHYEVSNYALPGFRSVHNLSYWTQEKYTGIGPGAHSYDGVARSINISHNRKYVKSIMEGVIPETVEHLTGTQKLNEYVMTRCRTSFGINPDYIKNMFGRDLLEDKDAELDQLERRGLIHLSDGGIFASPKGYLMADEIALKLFYDE